MVWGSANTLRKRIRGGDQKMSTDNEILEQIFVRHQRRFDSVKQSSIQWPLKILQNAYLTKTFQYRFPRCKSKRIAKKWRKDTRNFKTVPSNDIWVVSESGTAICHPDTARLIAEKMKHEFDERIESSLYDLMMPQGILR